MTPGSKMPSLRKCSQELKLSRTTIETAYLQLAADGYIMAKAQSGYYVTEIASHQHKNNQPGTHKETHYRYDLASSGVDKESFSSWEHLRREGILLPGVIFPSRISFR